MYSGHRLEFPNLFFSQAAQAGFVTTAKGFSPMAGSLLG
jgi:hypothetical protein